MYTPLNQPVPEITLHEPETSHAVVSFFRTIMQPYARSIRFKEPVMLHPERIVDAYQAFFDKKIRLIVGFRHAYGDDPQLMAYVFHHVLPKAARKINKPFKTMTHAHFVYGVEVPLWSGGFVRWLLPKAGAVPVDHIHMDSAGMNRIRKIIADGEYPLALAPEGHVTYDSGTVAELETGTARFGFWCVDDLKKQNRAEQVWILPVSQHYRTGKHAERDLDRLITRMEADCGIGKKAAGSSIAGGSATAARLRSVGESILAHLRIFYGELDPKKTGNAQAEILESALDAAERILAVEGKGKGDPMTRIYRIRSIAWGRIYRSDIDGMTLLRKEMAGRETGEAWYAMRHMETAELLCHVDLAAVPENAFTEDYMEIANNFYDFIERQKGGTLRNRANITDKYAIVVPGEPIAMNDYYDLYKTDKKAALQAATDDLRGRFEKCIEEYHHEYR